MTFLKKKKKLNKIIIVEERNKKEANIYEPLQKDHNSLVIFVRVI